MEAARERGTATRLSLEADVRMSFYEVVAGEARLAALRDSLVRVDGSRKCGRAGEGGDASGSAGCGWRPSERASPPGSPRRKHNSKDPGHGSRDSRSKSTA